MPVTIRTAGRAARLSTCGCAPGGPRRGIDRPVSLGARERAGRPDAVPRGRGAAAHHRPGAARRRAGRPSTSTAWPRRASSASASAPAWATTGCPPSWSPPPSGQASALVEVPRPTPFIAISRFVAAALAADEYAAVSRSAAMQQELARAALAPGAPATVLERLVREVGGWALLIDAAGAALEAVPRAAAARAAGAAAGAGPAPRRARPRERGAPAAGGDGPRAVARRRAADPGLPRRRPGGRDPGARAARRQHRRPRC